MVLLQNSIVVLQMAVNLTSVTVSPISIMFIGQIGIIELDGVNLASTVSSFRCNLFSIPYHKIPWSRANLTCLDMPPVQAQSSAFGNNILNWTSICRS
jgi:hypothetical protein